MGTREPATTFVVHRCSVCKKTIEPAFWCSEHRDAPVEPSPGVAETAGGDVAVLVEALERIAATTSRERESLPLPWPGRWRQKRAQDALAAYRASQPPALVGGDALARHVCAAIHVAAGGADDGKINVALAFKVIHDALTRPPGTAQGGRRGEPSGGGPTLGEEVARLREGLRRIRDGAFAECGSMAETYEAQLAVSGAMQEWAAELLGPNDDTYGCPGSAPTTAPAAGVGPPPFAFPFRVPITPVPASPPTPECDGCEGTGYVCTECGEAMDECCCDEGVPVEDCPKCRPVPASATPREGGDAAGTLPASPPRPPQTAESLEPGCQGRNCSESDCAVCRAVPESAWVTWKLLRDRERRATPTTNQTAKGGAGKP